MFGSFLTRGLVLFFGYAYPAFECFKTVEKNKVEIEELRFWCQYWIIVAVMTAFERVGDIFVSWLPLYGEAKLLLFIYMWYPKTKGCRQVYEGIVRPYIASHETDIDRSLLEFRTRTKDFVLSYTQNYSKVAIAKVLEIIQYVATQSVNVVRPPTPDQKAEKKSETDTETPPSTPPMPPPSPRVRGGVAQSPRAQVVKSQLAHIEEEKTTLHDERKNWPKLRHVKKNLNM